MADNVGGLNYQLNVGGNWDSQLSAFEARVNKLKTDAAKATGGGASGGGTSSTSNQLERSRLKDIANANKQITKELDLQAASVAKRQRAGMIASDREAKQIQQAALYNNLSAQASARNAASARELAIRQNQVSQIMKDQNISWVKAARQVGITADEAKRLGRHLVDAESVARRFLFTFRRLVGILAIFTAARLFAQAIGKGVQEMIRMNSEIETTKNSIATLISSVGRVYDSQGNLLTGQEAFTAAVHESDAVVKQLQKDAIGSVATFESLTKAFQVAVGPGLAAGLDVKQVTEVTKRLVEGAVAMKVPLEQMSEEIRSILQGTATSKNTRLVSLFGNSAADVNRQIREAKEQGRLYEYLTQKLSQVQYGALNAASSMAVLTSDLQDTTSLLAQQGGLDYFNALKEAVLGLRNALASSDKEKGVVFNPDALGIVREMSSIMAGLINTFRQFTDTQTNLNLLRNTLASIADVLAVIFPIVVTVFQGILTGVNAVLAPLRLVVEGFKALFDAAKLNVVAKGLLTAVKYLVAGAVFLAIWSNSLKLITVLTGASGLLTILKKVVLYFAVVALQAQGLPASMAVTTLLTQGWLAVLRLASAQMLIAFGWIGLIVGVIAIVLQKTGLWAKLMEKISPSMKGLNDEMGGFGSKVRGALGDVGDLRAELKNSTEDIKKMNEEIALAKALEHVKDSSKEIVSLYIQRQQAIADVTQLEEESIKNAQKELEILRAQTDEVTAKNKAAVSSGAISVTEGVFASVENAQKETDILQRINALEDDRKTKIQAVNAEYDKRIEKARVEARIKRDDALAVQQIEATGAMLAAQARGDALADAVVAKTKQAVLEEQVKIEQRSLEATKASIQEEISKQEAQQAGLKDYEQKAKELQQKLNDLKAPDLTPKLRRAELEKDIAELKSQLKESDLDKSFFTLATEKNPKKDRLRAMQKELGDIKDSGADSRAVEEEKIYQNQKKAISDRLAVVQEDVSRSVGAAEEIKRLKQEGIDIEVDHALAMQRLETQRIQNQKELIRTQLAASEKFTDGVKLGLMDFEQGVGTWSQEIAGNISSALGDLSSTIASQFKDAIDPRTQTDLKTAFGELFLNLAGSFVQTITDQLIKSAVIKLGFDLPGQAAQLTATTANTGALSSLTGAVGILYTALSGNAFAVDANTGAVYTGQAATDYLAGATTVNAVSTDANTATTAADSVVTGANTAVTGIDAASTNLNSAVTGANTGATIGQTVATWAQEAATWINTLWLQIKSFFKYGGLVGYNTGGKVASPKGYAGGGGIPRPASIPASDTVPAWLTPGEYVLPVPLVKKIGVGFLERLRSGVVSPDSFRDASAFMSGGGVRAYATGGPVASTNAPMAQGQQTIVLPVMPANDNTIDQMLTGGRKAFNKKVSQAPSSGDPNASKRW